MTEPTIVQVPGVSTFGKIFFWFGGALLAFVFIGVWVSSPKFVQGPIDFPEILMGIITLAMLGLCAMMPFMAQSWVRVSITGLEMKFIRHRAVRFDEIESIERAQQLNALIINVCVTVRLKLKSGKACEFFVATPEDARKLFQIMDVHVPGAAQTVIQVVNING